jgi:hypothetical protein
MALTHLTVGLLSLGAWALTAIPLAAQTTTSPAAAREVVDLMTRSDIETFAVQDAEAAGRFIATLLIPGVQLLVVSADYPAPGELGAQIERKNYRDVYTALHQPVSAQTRFFLIDLACDGLHDKSSAVDVLYERGTTQTVFNGDWKNQGLTEAGYRTRVEDADRRYTRMLNRLREALKVEAPGV